MHEDVDATGKSRYTEKLKLIADGVMDPYLLTAVGDNFVLSSSFSRVS